MRFKDGGCVYVFFWSLTRLLSQETEDWVRNIQQQKAGNAGHSSVLCKSETELY